MLCRRSSRRNTTASRRRDTAVMRIVQVANFYGPRSGGLRTAVDQLGRGYTDHGHSVTVIVPGRTASEEVLDSGVARITVPAIGIPGTGGYRVADPRRVTDLLVGLAPDALEVSDRLTLRGLGPWARRRGIASVMISHERLDRLLGQVMPARWARAAADIANARTAAGYDAVVCTTAFARAEFDRIGATNVHRVPLGVDLDLFHPRRRNTTTVEAWRGGSSHLLVHCGRLSVEKHVERSIDTCAGLIADGVDARLVIAGDGPRRASLTRRAAGLPVEFTGVPRQSDAGRRTARRRRRRPRPGTTRDLLSVRVGIARRGDTGRRLTHLGRSGDGDRPLWCDRGQHHRRVRRRCAVGVRAVVGWTDQRATACRGLRLAVGGAGHARRARPPVVTGGRGGGSVVEDYLASVNCMTSM